MTDWDASRWPHFKPAEIACRCCGQLYIWAEALDALERLRAAMNAPLHIDSGHRCGLHNARVGGAPLSMHKKLAFDIALERHNPRQLAQLANECGFTGFGFGQTFLHLDPRASGALVLWHKEQSKMDILGDLLGTGASALTGGLFGLVGNIATKVFGYFEAKQAFTQKQAEWGHETELLKLQMQAKAAETEQELRIAESQGSWSGLTASLTAEGAIGTSYPWVNAARALVRPTLTIGLSTFLACAFFAMAPGDIDRAYVADSLVFAAVTSIVWWFGDRASKKSSH